MKDPVSQIVIIYSAIACFGAFIGLLLFRRAIPPNHLCGFRFRQSFASEEAWYDINARGGVFLMIWSAVLELLMVIMLAIDPRPDSIEFKFLAASPVVLIIPGLQAWLYAHQGPKQ